MTEKKTLVPPDAKALRQTLGRFATGVTVITTTGEDGERYGMTANSLTSVSLEPPLLLVCFSWGTRTADAVLESRKFGVNILSGRQLAISKRFSTQGADHFADVQTEDGPLGVPLISNSVAQLVCTVSQEIEAGDHVIVVGEIVHAYFRDGQPLCFFGGSYGDFRTRGEVADFWYF
jgi:flavin reductase (DIM6/NTAB) family NADH-FMN oxidoreductase RutF